MFFTMSKLFWLVAQPISLVFGMMVLAILLLAWGRRRLAIATITFAAMLLGILSFTSAGFLLIKPLEDRFAIPAAPPQDVGAIVLLGGGTMSRPSTARQVVALNDAGDRLPMTLWLADRYPEALVVLSGGSGSGMFTGETETEAQTTRRFLAAFGVDESRLVLEGASRNTAENAAFTRDVLAGVDGAVMLVTSAYHMPRSVSLFEAEGIEVVPWPTDYRSTGRERFGLDLANPGYNLETATTAIREWIGLAVYHWTGRTRVMFPAP